MGDGDGRSPSSARAGRLRALRWGVWLYVVALHVGLTAALWEIGRLRPKASGEEELGAYYRTTLGHHRRLDACLGSDAVLFFGDSLVQSMDVTGMARHVVNFGIGGDTAKGLSLRLPSYGSVSRASAVVVAVGLNDLKVRDAAATLEEFGRLLETVPPRVPLLVSAVLPVDEAILRSRGERRRTNLSIRELNEGLMLLCDRRPNCRLVDAGPLLVDPVGKGLRRDVHVGDGVHLNPLGYEIWTGVLKSGLADLPRAGGR